MKEIKKIIIDPREYEIPIWYIDEDDNDVRTVIPVQFVAHPDLVCGNNPVKALKALHTIYELGVARRTGAYDKSLDDWYREIYDLADEVVDLLCGFGYAQIWQYSLA